VCQVGYLQGIYRDARSAKHKILVHSCGTTSSPTHCDSCGTTSSPTHCDPDNGNSKYIWNTSFPHKTMKVIWKEICVWSGEKGTCIFWNKKFYQWENLNWINPSSHCQELWVTWSITAACRLFTANSKLFFILDLGTCIRLIRLR